MKINHVRIKNLLGISALEFDAGKFVEIKGRNGTGKTSAIEALKCVFRGGHDATLLRNGEEKGEAVLELSNEESLKTMVTASSTDRYIHNGKRKIGSVSDIKNLIDSISINPVEFLTASKDKRVNILLESLPIRIDSEIIEKEINRKIDKNICDLHALKAIDVIRKEIYDDRTDTNGAMKQALAGKERTLATMPAEKENSNAFDEDELIKKREDLLLQKDEISLSIKTKLDNIKKKTEKEISELFLEIDAIKEKIAEKKEFINEQEKKGNQLLFEKCQEINDSLSKVNESLSLIKKDIENVQRIKIAKEFLLKADNDISVLMEASKKMTSNLEFLDEYKLSLLKKMLVKGLEVKENDLFFNGIPFDRVNTAKQVEIAIAIAIQRADDLPVIFVDGIERLDEKTYEEFKRQMLKTDCQVFVSRVFDSELQINNY